MSKRVHLDNLMRARLRRMVDKAMPEYDAVMANNRKLEALVLKAIDVIRAEGYGSRGEAFLAEASAALYGPPVEPSESEAA